MATAQEVRNEELTQVALKAAASVLKQQHLSEDRIRDMVAEAVAEATSKVSIEAAQLAATKAVTDTLVTLGLDPKDRDKIVRNFIFLDDIRGMWNAVVRHAILAVVAILASGIVSAIWFAVKSAKS